MVSSKTRIGLAGVAIVAGLAVAGCGGTVAQRHHSKGGTTSQTTTTPSPSAYTPPLLVTPTDLSQVVIAEFKADLHPAHLTIGIPLGTPMNQLQAFEVEPSNSTWDALQIPFQNDGAWFSPPPAASASAQATELRQWAKSYIGSLGGSLTHAVRTSAHVWIWVSYNRSKDTIMAILAWQ